MRSILGPRHIVAVKKFGYLELDFESSCIKS